MNLPPPAVAFHSSGDESSVRGLGAAAHDAAVERSETLRGLTTPPPFWQEDSRQSEDCENLTINKGGVWIMNAGWIAAFACGAAFALGGCSGNGAAAPTGPAGSAEPAPDERTEAQKNFDQAFDRAEAELAEARENVSRVLAELAAAESDEGREEARAKLDAARTSLSDAESSAQALSALASDASMRERAADLLRRATEARDIDAKKIGAAIGEAHWPARASVIRVPVQAALPEVGVVRRIRENAAQTGNSPDLLTAGSFPAVPYAPGKVLISEGEASSGDLLRMRGYTVSQFDNLYWELQASNYDDLFYGDRSILVAGLRVTPSGLVVTMGGRGAAGIDFRRQIGGRPSSLYIGGGSRDRFGWDLTLTFGEPTRSPEGNGEFYWAARLMPDETQTAVGSSPALDVLRFVVDGRPKQTGTYTLYLSNHAIAERNLEPVEGSVAYPGAAYPEDDVNSYLKYAAYGMMTFHASDQFPYDYVRFDRVQSFHSGYDAFTSASGGKTTDIGEAVSNGKFTGLTIALELDRIPRGNADDQTSIDLRLAKRLRGDVELTATISGTASDNTIKGRIKNLEIWDNRGYWKDYARIPDDIELESASIDAKGEYRGTITDVPGFNRPYTGESQEGQYVGTFYGPVSALETAGSWFLHGDKDGHRKAVVGSFGAKRTPAE